MALIFVCSPLRATAEKTMDQHLVEAAGYAEQVRAAGHVPVAPHLWLAPHLNDEDPRQRVIGMAMGRSALVSCDEVWVFGDRVSEGMSAEIQSARSMFKPVVFKNSVLEAAV